MFSFPPTCSESEYQAALKLTAQYAPAAPAGWVDAPFPADSPWAGLRCYRRKGDKLAVIFNASTWDDGRVWLHVSLSRPSRMPSYDDMCDVKRLFIGASKKAIQVFAAESDHVNIHPFCLHLWSCVEPDGLPDFGKHGTI